MLWVLFSVLASIVNAIYFMCLQNIHLQSRIFMIYRGMAVALMVVPFLFFYQPLIAWQFYAIALAQGLIIAALDLRLFKANHRYGAETVSSITPLTVAAVFIIWCIIEPAIIIRYAQSPLQSTCILAALSGIIIALAKYRHVPFTKSAFIYLIPVILLDAVCSVLNKTIMQYSLDSLYGLCFWRIFITSLAVGFIHLFIYIKDKQPLKEIVAKSNLSRAWFLALMPASMLSRNMAMYYTENPSYVSAIVYTSLLWIMVINRYFRFIHFKRIYLQMEKKWAIIMLVSVIVLILATN